MMNAYFVDTISVKVATTDTWGTKTFSTTAYKGRFEYKTKMVRNLQGEMVVSTAYILLPATVTIKHADLISYIGQDYSILGIEMLRDFSTRYLKVVLA